jgi:hypothetical protein
MIHELMEDLLKLEAIQKEIVQYNGRTNIFPVGSSTWNWWEHFAETPQLWIILQEHNGEV